MKSLLAPIRSPAELAQLFADRERLTGRTRERFLELLHVSLVPALARTYGYWRLLLGCCAAFPLLAFGLFRLVHETWPPLWLAAGYLGFTALGFWLAFGYRRARAESQADVETSWAAYCTLFRPALLEHLPGMLDRNLAEDYSEKVRVVSRRALSLRDLWREKDEEFWSATLSGLGVGLVMLVGTDSFFRPHPAMLLIPVVVTAIWLALWIGWNRRVKISSR